jgi:hypothetical protein
LRKDSYQGIASAMPSRAQSRTASAATLDQFPVTKPPGWGYSLPIVYLIWACVVLALYPLCRWFAALKQRRNDAWLSYF